MLNCMGKSLPVVLRQPPHCLANKPPYSLPTIAQRFATKGTPAKLVDIVVAVDEKAAIDRGISGSCKRARSADRPAAGLITHPSATSWPRSATALTLAIDDPLD
jgi:hypothetical protein